MRIVLGWSLVVLNCVAVIIYAFVDPRIAALWAVTLLLNVVNLYYAYKDPA